MCIRFGVAVLLLGGSMGLAQSFPAVGAEPHRAGSCNGESGPPLRVSSGALSGLLVKHPYPVYPREAWEQHVSGSVVLSVCIGADGHVEKVQPISGPQMLRQVDVDAVLQWEYRPYLLNGTAVPVMTVITLENHGVEPLELFCGDARPGDRDFHVRVSSGTMAGQLISRPDPVVPPVPREAHVSGASVVKVCISREGRVEKVETVMGPELLRKPVKDMVKQWVYRPYVVNGKPVPVVTIVTMNIEFGGG